MANTVINFITLYDIPKTILSDNGTEFCATLMNTSRTKLNIRQVLCTPHHSQSNGQLERTHGTLKDYLSFYNSIEKMNEWDMHLGLAASAFNKSTYSTLGLSPHEMVFGQLPNLPISDDDTDPDINNQAALAFQLQDKLCYLHDLVRENIDAQKQNTKEHYDKKMCPIYLKAGDMVFLKNFHRETKLSPHYVGPYPIVREHLTMWTY